MTVFGKLPENVTFMFAFVQLPAAAQNSFRKVGDEARHAWPDLSFTPSPQAKVVSFGTCAHLAGFALYVGTRPLRPEDIGWCEGSCDEEV